MTYVQSTLLTLVRLIMYEPRRLIPDIYMYVYQSKRWYESSINLLDWYQQLFVGRVSFTPFQEQIEKKYNLQVLK